jgi:hypothetical protein
MDPLDDPESYDVPTDPQGQQLWLAIHETRVATLIAQALDRIVVGAYRAFTEALTAAADLTPLDTIPSGWSRFVHDTLGDTLANTHLAGAAAAFKQAPDMPAPRATAWVKVVNQRAVDHMNTATNRLVGVGDEMWRKVQQQVRTALADGSSNEDLKDAIAQVSDFTEYRADTIARTETMGAYNAGHQEGAVALGEYGPTERYWVAAHDRRTRASHDDADGQVRKITEPFSVGGASMDRPHDPNAPAAETVNCRCTMGFLYPGDSRPDGTEVPARTDTAPPTPPEQPPATSSRTRATATDPDVLAEASRRGVSAERVLQLRGERAERRALERRARAAAERSLSADHPDVIRVARHNGVHPDEVLSARQRVGDVRAAAREAAARVQADAMRELDRLDSVKLQNPPRKGARSDLGTSARRGEWDWLEQVSDKEKNRLSRSWYGGSAAPDQMAHTMGDLLGRDMDVDQAVGKWLDLNRRAEASGALRRGKLPSLDAYSGQIDPQDLIGPLADDGFDAVTLFGDDLDAAGHIASVERRLVEDDALGYLGDAARAVEGPAPYRMGFQSWEEEVRTIEFHVTEGTASDVERRRLGELVPSMIDEPGLDYEDLYARIVSTARKAGEEVPEYARIPWD